MPRRFTYDTYHVDIPSDAFDNPGNGADLAIAEARERARIYAMPATWTARIVKPGAYETRFRVTRKRNRAAK